MFFEDGHLFFGGCQVLMFGERDSVVIDWGVRGVDVVIDAMGVFCKWSMVQKYFDVGVRKVLIMVLVIESDRMVVLSVNDEEFFFDDRIVFNASCTTNCFVSVVRVLDEVFGVYSLVFMIIYVYIFS